MEENDTNSNMNSTDEASTNDADTELQQRIKDLEEIKEKYGLTI